MDNLEIVQNTTNTDQVRLKNALKHFFKRRYLTGMRESMTFFKNYVWLQRQYVFNPRLWQPIVHYLDTLMRQDPHETCLVNPEQKKLFQDKISIVIMLYI